MLDIVDNNKDLLLPPIRGPQFGVSMSPVNFKKFQCLMFQLPRYAHVTC